VLLAQKTEPIQHLPRSGARGLDPAGKLDVLALEAVEPLRTHPRGARGGVDSLDPRFGLERTPAKRCKLVAKVTYELLELMKRNVRSFAV